MRVTALMAEHARDIVSWRYPPPYERYGMGDVDPTFLLDPANGYLALVADDTEDTADTGLVGYRCFGADARVPGGTYDDTALDTGGGLRPDLTGRGVGRAAIEVGLAHGRAQFAPAAFRVTVAAANVRALRVLRSLGFRATATFTATTDGTPFEILRRPEA